MKISVAAVPYYWSKEKYQSFYAQLVKSAVDIVYLGETVCSKRRSMKLEDWIEIALKLQKARKQVALSTMTLLEADSELDVLRKICQQHEFFVEANDTAAIQIASSSNNTFALGSAINLYNNTSLQLYQKMGMTRWCSPVELGKQDLLAMMPLVKSLNIELEYQVFGRLPLAFSARCFTARHHRLPKDHCQFKCLEDEQGILVKTQEGENFAQINGIQTQSSKVCNLFNQWRDMRDFGIDVLRVMPVSATDTLEVVNQLAAMIERDNIINLDTSRLNHQYQYCNGYWFQIEGMKMVS